MGLQMIINNLQIILRLLTKVDIFQDLSLIMSYRFCLSYSVHATKTPTFALANTTCFNYCHDNNIGYVNIV